MATPKVRAVPGALDLEIWRGDDIDLELVLVDDDDAPMVLPTSGWASDVKQAIGGDVLASFTIDASQGADGIIHLILAAADNAVETDKCVWDLQCSTGGKRTYLAGKCVFEGEVTLA